MKVTAGNRGLIKTVILIIAALLVLSYLGFNLRDFANSPTVRDNFSFAESMTVGVWNDYLKRPAEFAWNEVLFPFVWQPSMYALRRLKSVQPLDFSATSSVPLSPPALP